MRPSSSQLPTGKQIFKSPVHIRSGFLSLYPRFKDWDFKVPENLLPSVWLYMLVNAYYVWGIILSIFWNVYFFQNTSESDVSLSPFSDENTEAQRINNLYQVISSTWLSLHSSVWCCPASLARIGSRAFWRGRVTSFSLK